jgi:hypothetical protein
MSKLCDEGANASTHARYLGSLSVLTQGVGGRTQWEDVSSRSVEVMSTAVPKVKWQ